MNIINQIVTAQLLNSISGANSSNSGCSNSNSQAFDFILNNAFSSLLNTNQGCCCKNQGTLDELDTILSLVNNNKVNTNNNVSAGVDSNKINNSKMDNAIELLESQLGKPYVWGATGPESFDCSGLVQYVYKHALGKDIPRVSYEQSEFGQSVDRENLQVGDLVFFDTMNKGRVSHVGMYVGNNEFIHASNPKDGVKKSTLSGYYEDHYKGARRP